MALDLNIQPNWDCPVCYSSLCIHFIQVSEDVFKWILENSLPLFIKIWQNIVSFFMAQVNNIDEISQDITEIILNSPLFLTLIEMVLVYFDHWILLVLLIIFKVVHNNCKTIAFMFNGGSCSGSIFVRLTPGFAWYFFIIRASDAVFSIFWNIFMIRGQLRYKGAPCHSFSEPPGGRKSKLYFKNREDRITGPYNKEVPYKFWPLCTAKSLSYHRFQCHYRSKKDGPQVIIMYYLNIQIVLFGCGDFSYKLYNCSLVLL